MARQLHQPDSFTAHLFLSSVSSLADSMGLNYIIIRASDLRRPLYGESESLLQEVINLGRVFGPIIIQFDEAELLFPRPAASGLEADHDVKMTGLLLTLLDTFDYANCGCFVILTTNYFDRIPENLRSRVKSIPFPTVQPRSMLKMVLFKQISERDPVLLDPKKPELTAKANEWCERMAVMAEECKLSDLRVLERAIDDTMGKQATSHVATLIRMKAQKANAAAYEATKQQLTAQQQAASELSLLLSNDRLRRQVEQALEERCKSFHENLKARETAAAASGSEEAEDRMEDVIAAPITTPVLPALSSPQTGYHRVPASLPPAAAAASSGLSWGLSGAVPGGQTQLMIQKSPLKAPEPQKAPITSLSLAAPILQAKKTESLEEKKIAAAIEKEEAMQERSAIKITRNKVRIVWSLLQPVGPVVSTLTALALSVSSL